MTNWVLALMACLVAPPAAAADRTSPGGREAYEIYRTLVAFPTVKGRGEVPKMARYLASKFKQAGFSTRDIEFVPIGETTGLIVTYRGSGKKSPVLFLGHMDVVEARSEDWQRDPFKLHEENGYFIGRGSSDNKSGIAQLTAAFLQLKRSGFKPNRDLIIAFSGDEETDMLTTRAIASKLALARPEFALNSDSGGGRADAQGNGTEFAVQVAEKTYATYAVTVRNPGGHSARPRPDNAIFELADLLRNLRAYNFPIMTNELTRRSIRAAARAPNVGVDLKAAMLAFAANPDDPAAQAILSERPALSWTLRTTCVPTQIIGGHAENALPQTATATINCRIFPEVSVASVQQKLAEIGANSKAEWKIVGNPSQSDPSPLNEQLFATLSRVVEDRFPALPVTPYMTPGATDGKHFRAAGVPTYGASAEFSIAGVNSFAHGLNERNSVAGFFESLEYWPKLMRLLAT